MTGEEIQASIAEAHRERKYRPVIVAAIRDKLNRFLFVRSAKEPNPWYLPQGGIEEGESAGDSLLREIEEELGILKEEVGPPVFLGVKDVDAPPGRKDKRGFSHGKRLFFFLSDYIGQYRKFEIKRDEISDYCWVAPENVPDILSKTREEKKSLIIKYIGSV